VIPGTEVSLRVGGQGVGSVLWYLKGQATGGALGGQGAINETYMDGQGGTGNLPSIPLNTHTFSNTAAPAGFSHSRSSNWAFSGKQTRFFFDARTPSPYGEVKGYIEMDFSASNTNTILNNNAGVTNGYIPRFRQGYATLGGLLMGQTNGTFVDNDADPNCSISAARPDRPGARELRRFATPIRCPMACQSRPRWRTPAPTSPGRSDRTRPTPMASRPPRTAPL